MYLIPEEKEKFRKVVISCEDGCDGFFTGISWVDDYSPRVEAKCSKCHNFMSVKLSSIDEKRIISIEIVDAYQYVE